MWYGCTTWTLTEHMEKRLDDNQIRMLRAVLNKFTIQQLYGHLPTIQVRWTRHAGDCWRSKDELLKDVLLWTLSHGQVKVGRPARTYLQLFCAWRICREWWTIEMGGKRGSGKSVLAVWHDDDKILRKEREREREKNRAL